MNTVIMIVTKRIKMFDNYKCEYCRLVNPEDCPRRDEVDKYGDSVRLFTTECIEFKPYQSPLYVIRPCGVGVEA